MINGIDMSNIVVTSMYELKYGEKRNNETYKSFPLLTETISRQLFDEFIYYIYTDKFTYDKYNIGKIFNRDNVKIVIRELNSTFYMENVEPTRRFIYEKTNDLDRIYSVLNYSEVIHNKIEFLKEVSLQNTNSNVLWLDSGLFGTSCHDGWRDYLRRLIYDNPILLNKSFEKIQKNGFISLLGEGILVNYELKNRILKTHNIDKFNVIPGGIFGGKSEIVLEYLNNNNNVLLDHIKTNNELLSEQDVLYILLHNKNALLYNFGDWLDFQKGILKILDMYYDEKYRKDKCYE